MNQEASHSSEQSKPKKNKYQFNLDRDRKIYIDSDFDNGNIGLIRQVTQLQYRLQAISDFKSSTPKKTWFHFRVSAPKNIRIRLIIQNVNIYENMYEDKDWARPVMNDGGGWKEVKDCFLTFRGQIGLIIDYTFSVQKYVYFAMAVPHSYEDCERYLRQLKYRIPQFVDYQDEIIGKSWGNLNLHLLRFTTKQKKKKQESNSKSGNIVPSNGNESQKKSGRIHSQASIQKTLILSQFSYKKPIIFITSRVHPGEVGSSHCLMGIIDFLTSFNNLQSYLLLKMFQVMIIPMVNPDGVFDGNYRMDLNNTNLNRVYQDPSPQLHPTVYKIREVVNSLVNPTLPNSNWNKEKFLSNYARKIMFHFDLHSHSCIKPAFIYGNAFDQIAYQTQSELYCKLLEHNSQVFKYSLSHFGQKHMKMKDKGEPLTKQGCARVVMSKVANIIYSYTVETSIFPYLNKQPLKPFQNTQFKLTEFLKLEQLKGEDLVNKYNIKNQMVIDNMLLGHSLMITILDILEKNPYPRFLNQEQLYQGYRKDISQYLLQNEQRFKLLDMKAYQKVRNIEKYCKQEVREKYQKSWDFIAQDQLVCSAKWPICFKMYQFSSLAHNCDSETKRKRNRIKTEVNEAQKQVSDFLNPKNLRKKYLVMSIDIEGQKNGEKNCQQVNKKSDEGQKQQKNDFSPTKMAVSPKNIEMQLENVNINGSNVNIRTNSNVLPDIRPSVERYQIHRNRIVANSLNRLKTSNEHTDNIHKQTSEQKEPKELQPNKNIVLQFIHQQLEKINAIRKNAQKSMAVQNKLASYKMTKKYSKSSKALQQIGVVNGTEGRYGIILTKNGVQQKGKRSLNKSKQALKIPQTCEEIILKRKQNKQEQNMEEQQMRQFEQEQGIYYVLEEQSKGQQISSRKHISDRNGSQQRKVTGSLEKITQYPIYTNQRSKDFSNMITNKRELAKVKYEQIRKKNIIRQDINNGVKLPELKNIPTNSNLLNIQAIKNGSRNQETQSSNSKPSISVNLNVNLNLNLNIQQNLNQITGRKRAATMPDQI